MTNKLASLALATVLAATAHTAHADGEELIIYERPDPYNYAWFDPSMWTGFGVSLTAGGGASGFTNSSTSDFAGTGGLWTARLLVGSHVPVGVEFSYAGIKNGGLTGTSVDTTVRWNILPHWDFCPFIYIGLGWQHYKTTGDRPMPISIDGDVDMASGPMGGGLAYRHWSGFVAEIRGTFRPVANPSNLEHTDISLNSWEFSATAGYEL